jgi:probable FeS assembly SUF system protein SufT
MIETGKPIQLRRDVEAVEIPAGFKVVLPVGSEVVVQQNLGGNFTVVTGWGHMLRIAGKDADALGADTAAAAPSPRPDKFDEQLVWEELKTVFDPEIPVNVVDLGLIYECKGTPLPSGKYRVEIKMTITAPGCGMGDILRSEVYSKVAALPGVSDVDVQMVFDPPWDPSKMSEGAKLQLGFM